MFVPFLESVANYVAEHHKDSVEKLCFVLPNKRGALFLKQYLAKAFRKTIWLPPILSAEEFISELSGIQNADEIDLVCELYECYRECYGAAAEPFDSFAKWGHLILQDFNEIDRYLADSKQLYENLKDIKVIENWSLGAEELSPFQEKYIEFMSRLGSIYSAFTEKLLEKNMGYQGLSYRLAAENIKNSDFPDRYEKILFCGFNALNAAELKITGNLYLRNKAVLLWDADQYYLDNPLHEAGHFLRKNFEYFRQKEPQFLASHFDSGKQISIISVPRQIGQAQVVQQCVRDFMDRNIPLDKVAIVLANEKLLWPVLQQLPSGVEHVNITMEYPLKFTSTFTFAESLIQLQLNFQRQQRKNKTIYHRELSALLQQPLMKKWLHASGVAASVREITEALGQRNISFVTEAHLREFFGADFSVAAALLTEHNDSESFCDQLLKALCLLQENFRTDAKSRSAWLELEYLEVVIRQLNRVSGIIKRYPHFSGIRAFRQLFVQIVGSSSASFIGEPVKGLQIMGVLETRTLDFEHVVIVNVNEGVLPSGKSINSFIPNDLKRAFGLPLYLEKDAIYSYHFFRLLQRAKEVVITCDSETDTFGKGEKSRFITQIELELAKTFTHLSVSEKVAGSSATEIQLPGAISIAKTEESLQRILRKATDDGEFGGLSPSGLITLKDCGLKFYFRYGAGLKELKEVEENAEANTFGSILHNTLEELYKPFCSQALTAGKLESLIPQVEKTVKDCFLKEFDTLELSGKNVLQEEVIKVYAEKLIRNDISFARILSERNAVLSLLHLETEFSTSLNITVAGENLQVYIRGKADRVDSYEHVIRIIDYKSSVKSADRFEFTSFDDLFNDPAYNKQFQLVMYAWLIWKCKGYPPERLQPGIIPFREFRPEPRILTRNKQPLKLTKEFLEAFENELSAFIAHIFSAHSVFSQTEDAAACEYCAYSVICNR